MPQIFTINKMIIKNTTSAIIILVSLSFILSRDNLYGQPMEIEKPTSKQAKRLEDVKKNLNVHLQNIANLESNINTLEEDLKTLNTTIEKLIENKTGAEAIDLVTKQKVIVEKRINTLNETIRVRAEIKDRAGYLGSIITWWLVTMALR